MLARLLFLIAQIITTLTVMLLAAVVADRGLTSIVYSYEFFRGGGLHSLDILPRLIDVPGSLRELLSAKQVPAQSMALAMCSAAWLAARCRIRSD